MFPGFCGSGSLSVKISFAHETSPVWASQIVFPAASSLFWDPFLHPSHLSLRLSQMHKALSVSLWDTNKVIRQYRASRISSSRLLLIIRVNNASVWCTYGLDVQYRQSFSLCLLKRPSVGWSIANVNALKYWWPLLAICLSLSILSAREPDINSVGCGFTASFSYQRKSKSTSALSQSDVP